MIQNESSKNLELVTVIGLEVHCQLATHTKIFCSCPNRSSGVGSDLDSKLNKKLLPSPTPVPNSNICPICAGHPGTLPSLNKKAVEFALKAGLSTHCRIRSESILARKNYFYPDLPKGYQISQYEHPLCENGYLEIETHEFGPKTIPIQRIHLEEDAGKTLHQSGYSLVDLNRAGVPLIEIVSTPSLSHPIEAKAYLRTLYTLVTYLQICDGNMQEGNFRCDANVSLMKSGATELGTRVEIKNLNSFRFVEKALAFEIQRQKTLLLTGKRVTQETRGYNSQTGETYPMRSKEQAEDYRYFPDPDLVPIRISRAWEADIKQSLPELPDQKKARFQSEWDLGSSEITQLFQSRLLLDFFESTMECLIQSKTIEMKPAAKACANWINGEITYYLKVQETQLQVTPKQLSDLIRLIAAGTISHSVAKTVFEQIWNNPVLSLEAIIEPLRLNRGSNETDKFTSIVDKIKSTYPNQALEYKSGKEKLLDFFVGKAMKELSGKANPSLLQELFKKKLKE